MNNKTSIRRFYIIMWLKNAIWKIEKLNLISDLVFTRCYLIILYIYFNLLMKQISFLNISINEI